MMTINCKHCNGVLIRDLAFEATSGASFNLALKCPHCQKPAKIAINAKLVAEVLIDGKPAKDEKCPHCGEKIHEEASSIRTL